MELHLTNALIHIHDLGCGCNDPLKHNLNLLLNNKIESTISEETKEKIKCLLSDDFGTTDAATTTEGDQDDIGIEEGELEELFKQDTDLDDDG